VMAYLSSSLPPLARLIKLRSGSRISLHIVGRQNNRGYLSCATERVLVQLQAVEQEGDAVGVVAGGVERE